MNEVLQEQAPRNAIYIYRLACGVLKVTDIGNIQVHPDIYERPVLMNQRYRRYKLAEHHM